MTPNQAAFYSWFSTFLRDRGLQFTRSGFKGGDSLGNHLISHQTGFWENAQYSAGKPPRWLFHIEVANGSLTATLPNDLAEIGIGASNTAQGDKAGLAVRILPLLHTDQDTFVRLDEFEINALFVFHGALSAGSSADPFTFETDTGILKRLGKATGYIHAALLGLRPRTDEIRATVEGQEVVVTYGDVLDAVQASFVSNPTGLGAGLVRTYDLSDVADLELLKTDIGSAWDAAGPAPVGVNAVPGQDDAEDDADLDYTHVDIPENADLLGLDPSVYRQINAMLKSGKQHIMLYGPPGTGKTSLARWVAGSLPGGKWTLITGSSDWSSQDIIGGYQPIGGGDVDFVPGILLREFDHPLIIDELNRCDIDKVIGPLFTVLSGQQTTLPYRTDITDKDSQPYTILPKPKPGAADHEYAPGPGWRLIATLNSIDKASLYQMSYALSRRFGWVYVDVPRDLAGFVRSYLAKVFPRDPLPGVDQACPIADIWKAINAVRVIGPAPIIDAIQAMRAIDPNVEFFGPASAAARSGMLDALDMVILPMLDGIIHQDAVSIANAAAVAFAFNIDEQAQVRTRLEAVAI